MKNDAPLNILGLSKSTKCRLYCDSHQIIGRDFMGLVNLNHSHVLSNASSKSLTQTLSSAAEVVVKPFKGAAATPSTIVSISDEGYTLSIQESLANEIKFVEKSDEAYKAMSFEELVDERDGKGKYRAEGDTTIYAMNSYGKAAKEAFLRVREQQMENARNARNLGDSLEQFRAKIIESNRRLSASDIGVEIKDGALTITGNKLTEDQKAYLQNVLESSLAEAKNLRGAITQFNEGGLKMINMMIYDERGHYGGENSEGRAVRHREEFVTMGEFLKNANYENIATSGGSYTWDKFNDLIGSTKWGAKLVFDE
jgi:hypothetical protein